MVILMITITVGTFMFFRIKNHDMTAMIENQNNEYFDKHYVLITDDRDTMFWQSVYEGAKEFGEANGAYVELLGNNLNENYNATDLMKIAIASNVDGIIIDADESVGMTQQINKAIESGIPVVTTFHDNTNSRRISYVGMSNYNIGMEYGNQICNFSEKYFSKLYDVKKMDRKTNIYALVLMNSTKTDAAENIIFSGIQDAVNSNEKYNERIKVRTESVNTTGNFSAEESIRDIFMKQEQKPDIVICLDELNTTCVYQAVVDYNKVGQINILGFYQSDTILNAIKRKVIQSTITIDTNQMGKYCVKALDEFIQTGHVSEYFSVDTSVIEQDNVDRYIGVGENED